MRQFKPILGALFLALFITHNIYSQQCSCNSVNSYASEYPSTGNNTISGGTYDWWLPVSVITSGDKIHFWFPNAPCLAGVTNPNCMGVYTASANGHQVTATNGTGANQHIQFPASYLQPGLNTIQLTATCGANTCTLRPTTVNVVTPGASTATITLTSECCTVPSAGPHSAPVNTGKIRVKMMGTASPGVKLRIRSGGSTNDILFVPASGAGDGYSGCYDSPIYFTVVDGLNAVMPNATINGHTYNSTLGYHLKTTKSLNACQKATPTSGGWITTTSYPHSIYSWVFHFKAGTFKSNWEIGMPNNIKNRGINYVAGGELTILPKGKKGDIIPTLDIEAGYGTFTVKTDVSGIMTKFPMEDANATVPTFTKTPDKATVFNVGAGPKVTFTIDRFNIGPGVLVGYQNFKLPAVQVVDSKFSINGQQLVYLNNPGITKGGLFLLPKLDMSYWISNRIALTADLAYNIGPKLATTIQRWEATDANGDGIYTNTELAMGAQVSSVVSQNMNYFRPTAGIKVLLGGVSCYVNKHITLIRKGEAQNQ